MLATSMEVSSGWSSRMKVNGALGPGSRQARHAGADATQERCVTSTPP
jgi:hypothetical protein